MSPILCKKCLSILDYVYHVIWKCRGCGLCYEVEAEP